MIGAPYIPSSETSRAAAESVVPHLSRMRGRVLAALAAHAHGATSDELEMYLMMRHQSVSPRLRELETIGLIYESEEKRKTRSGREAFVWKLTGVVPPIEKLKKNPRPKANRKESLKAIRVWLLQYAAIGRSVSDAEPPLSAKAIRAEGAVKVCEDLLDFIGKL